MLKTFNNVLESEKKSSIDEVFISLSKYRKDTNWSEKTNHFAVNHINFLTREGGDCWYHGFLLKEDFLSILLQQHGHCGNNNKNFFEENTSVISAVNYFKNPHLDNTKDCISLINYLKNEIKKNGFNSEIILVSMDDKLKHVDGLHRMIALGLLLDEGYRYEPVPVFLFKKYSVPPIAF